MLFEEKTPATDRLAEKVMYVVADESRSFACAFSAPCASNTAFEEMLRVRHEITARRCLYSAPGCVTLRNGE